MYDSHYDLLTYIYMNKTNLDEVKVHCKEISNNNLNGGIFNLFYMSEKEMEEELGIHKDEINIIENLKQATHIIEKENIIPKNIKYKIGIEGLDYLEKIEDIDKLYNLGVRSVNIVWNNHNKFATGVRPYKIINKKQGLTELGKQLIKKLIETKIAIDLSHADEKTFWDVIEQCKKYKNLGPKILVSHSNCKALCDVPRNITDEQILAIKQFNGLIGLVSVKQFCSKNTNVDYKQEYIKHINYVKNILGGVDNIVLATDDMTYYKIEPEIYQTMNVFKQKNVRKEIISLLKENNYTNIEIEKITKKNFEKFFF